MIPENRQPAHPGTILLEEFLKPIGVTQSQFTEHLGGSWTQPKLSDIIIGKRRITEAIALDLADALGTTPQFWMNLQSQYDLWQARQQHESIPLLPELKAQNL